MKPKSARKLPRQMEIKASNPLGEQVATTILKQYSQGHEDSVVLSLLADSSSTWKN